ncbi:hypothetical protein COB21_04325 [Candidatus Aerophobetes bacterium]|uniref:Uncharacterized protein n=1 Tax=Aerophobetes bacterium TaxID=2030807 RepID=A0A2A4X186_UNCAE|nr:MAG: hypothetical protein COB21_04325 [Candidatus Aerophobetes bacterium]
MIEADCTKINFTKTKAHMRLSKLSQKFYFFLLLVLVASLPATKGFCKKRIYGPLTGYPDIGYAPWFTGPLLSPTPVNMPPDQPALEPSVIIGSTYGQYDANWKFKSGTNTFFINPSVDFQFGFTERTGLEIFAPLISNFKNGVSSTKLQDIALLLGFQIATDIRGSWVPDIRIDLQEVFPAGSYQKLSPEKLGTDLTGYGSYQTGPLLVINKTFYSGDHPLAIKASIAYLFPSNVHVKGLNTYGGGFGTNGTVHPGQTLTMFLSFEHAITKKWGWGFDSLYIWQTRSTFSGSPGITADGNVASMGQPSLAQFSLAPYVEYTFTSQLGVVGGAWCTLGGRNADAFASGYFAFLYIF